MSYCVDKNCTCKRCLDGRRRMDTARRAVQLHPATKQQQDQPCQCGSGYMYKNCCGFKGLEFK